LGIVVHNAVAGLLVVGLYWWGRVCPEVTFQR
jgi:hypothetical protein